MQDGSLERYSRQMRFYGIGESGQKKLLDAHVTLCGCGALGTVLANEEVVDGKSERGGHPVVRMPLRQWLLRITDYAERLLDDLKLVDWPEPIKKMQRDWIGRSEGAEVDFKLASPPPEGPDHIKVFTTRPDTSVSRRSRPAWK